ncbi:MAG: hypothetical protein V3S39_03305, partial [Thermodesulfobacteriota bacterium]
MCIYNRGFLLLVVSLILAAFFCSSLYAESVVVDAKTNSSAGGTGKDTGIDIRVGDLFIIKVNPAQSWRAGNDHPYSRKSNANGIAKGYGKWTQGNLSANYGSLVGRIGKSDYFLIGTAIIRISNATGRLFLYYWDSNSGDNSGNISADIIVSSVATPRVPAQSLEELAHILIVEGDPRTSDVRRHPYTTNSNDINAWVRRLRDGYDLASNAWKRLIDDFFYPGNDNNHHKWKDFEAYVKGKAIPR